MSASAIKFFVFGNKLVNESQIRYFTCEEHYCYLTLVEHYKDAYATTMLSVSKKDNPDDYNALYQLWLKTKQQQICHLKG